MLELQCPVRKSKQFGGRSKTESHTRSERQLRMRVWLFPLLNRKEASLVTRGGLPAPTPQGLTPKSGAFRGKAGFAAPLRFLWISLAASASLQGMLMAVQ